MPQKNDFKTFWKAKAKYYRTHIIEFAHEVLKTKPDPIQTKFLLKVQNNEAVSLRSGHGIGKTYCIGIITNWFISCFPNSRVITTAPTARQVKEVTWAEIHKRAEGTFLHQLFEYQTTKIMITKSWGAIGVSSSLPENMEGFHADNLLFIVDEAKGVMQKIFDAIMGTQTTNTKMVLVSTPSPNPLGEFFDSFKPGSIYETCHFTCHQSKRPGMPKYIAMMKKKYGENSPIYQMKVNGDFPDVSEDTLIPWQHIDAACSRNITIDVKKEFHRILSCDVARFGNDITVIFILEWQKVNGLWVKKLVDHENFNKQPTNYTAGRIVEMDKKWNCKELRVDAGGGDLGAGVVDQLMMNDTISHKVVAFVAGGKQGFSDEDNWYYLNWKSKAFDHLRKIFEEGRIDIKDYEELVEQLTLLRKDYSTGQKLKILDYGEELKGTDVKHKSPDYADALSIGCAPLMEDEVHVLEDDDELIF